MHIPDKSVFQPSNEALTMWLGARKPSMRVGSSTVPGFLSDTAFPSDLSWFLFGMFGELVGLVATVYAGVRAGGVYLLISVVGIVLFIFCDLFFAKLLHRKKPLLCRLEAEIDVAEKPIMAKTAFEAELHRGRLTDFMLRTGIIVIALVKTTGIVVLGLFPNLGLYVPFGIVYLIVAYVHINHTGYFLAYYSAQRRINSERSNLHSDRYQAQEVKEIIWSGQPLSDLPIKHNPHVISAYSDTEGAEQVLDTDRDAPQAPPRHRYVLVSKGVLTDDDITNLVDGQEEPGQIEIFKGCRRLQLRSVPKPR